MINGQLKIVVVHHTNESMQLDSRMAPQQPRNPTTVITAPNMRNATNGVM